MSKQEVAVTGIEQRELLLLLAPILGGAFGIFLAIALATCGRHPAWVLALLPLGSPMALIDPQLTLPLGLAAVSAITSGLALHAAAYLSVAVERTVFWRKRFDPFFLGVAPSDRKPRSAEDWG